MPNITNSTDILDLDEIFATEASHRRFLLRLAERHLAPSELPSPDEFLSTVRPVYDGEILTAIDVHITEKGGGHNDPAPRTRRVRINIEREF